MADESRQPRFTSEEFVVHQQRRDEVARYHLLVDGPEPSTDDLLGLATEIEATVAQLKDLPSLSWFAADHTKRRKHLQYLAGERQTVPHESELDLARQRFVLEGDGFATADDMKHVMSEVRTALLKSTGRRLVSPATWSKPMGNFWDWGTTPVCPPEHRLPRERAMELLREAYDFTDDDLAANREGRLTPEQAERHGVRVTAKVRRVAGPVVIDRTRKSEAAIQAKTLSRRFPYSDALAAGIPEAILYWGQGWGKVRVFSIEPYDSGEARR